MVIDKIKEMVSTNNIPDTLKSKEKDDFVILNYKPQVQFDNSWTDIEIACRGLIINKRTLEIVARPFDKFFNWGENNRKTYANIKNVSEKMDGSFGILYRDNGYFKIATRGSFTSEQAIFATDYFNKNHKNIEIPNSWTLMFEIIYPENKIVVDYGSKEKLVLLDIRNRFSGDYIDKNTLYNFACKYDFESPKMYDFDIDEIISLCSKIDYNKEGWVVEFEDGQRFKFKGDEYKRLHKTISGLSFKLILENHAEGTLDETLGLIPDEFKDDVKIWTDQINKRIECVNASVNSAFDKAPKNTRKEYSLWCKECFPELLPYMFAKLDGKDITPIIYKHEFKGD